MKPMLFLLLLVFSFNLKAQNTGNVFYLNQIKASEDIEQMKKYGLNVEISPILVNIQNVERLNSLLEDYKGYIKTYYRQINSISFLSSEDFYKLDKRKMIVQTLCYVQYKNRDYKWGGCKYFEIFHVNSDLFFTPVIREYSDRYEMEITVAEKIKALLP